VAADARRNIIKLCEDPQTGEQIKYNAAGAPSCPEGFHTYYDLTPAYVETVRNIPPPAREPGKKEQEAHDE